VVEKRNAFEYCFIPCPIDLADKELLETLNGQGHQGWEMVTAIDRASVPIFVFKRLKITETDRAESASER
jgi:hypothetical protein